MHEPFDTLVELDLHPSRRNLRAFGIAAALACLAIAFGVAHSGWPDRESANALRSMLFAAATLCAGAAWLRPAWLRPLHMLMTCATFPVRFVFAWASLLVLFFLVLTPIALAVRRLRTRINQGSGSAWLPARKRPERARYFRQS
jgi:hypothetical protein